MACRTITARDKRSPHLNNRKYLIQNLNLYKKRLNDGARRFATVVDHCKFQLNQPGGLPNGPHPSPHLLHAHLLYPPVGNLLHRELEVLHHEGLALKGESPQTL